MSAVHPLICMCCLEAVYTRPGLHPFPFLHQWFSHPFSSTSNVRVVCICRFCSVCTCGAQVFLEELSKAAGSRVAFSGSSGDETSPGDPGLKADAAVPATVAPAPASDTVEQMQSVVFQAQKLGFVTGALVVRKDTNVSDVFKIHAYESTNVTLLQQHLGRSKASNTIPVTTFVNDWRLHKGTVTELLPNYHFETSRHSPLASPLWKYDAVKAKITLALQHAYNVMEVMATDLELFTKPASVRTRSRLEVGELFLAPATQRFASKDVHGAIALGKYDLGGDSPDILFLLPHFVQPISANGKVNAAPWVCPFWHCNAASPPSMANLALKAFEVTIAEHVIKIPVLTNTNVIEAEGELLWDKGEGKVFKNKRSYITMQDINKALKKRRLV